MGKKSKLGKRQKLIWNQRQNRKSAKLQGIYYLCHVLFPSLLGKHTCHLQCLLWEKHTSKRWEKSYFILFIFFSVPSDNPALRNCLQNPHPQYCTDSQPASRNSGSHIFTSIHRDPIYGTISTVWQRCLNLLGKESQYGCVFWVRLAPVANKSEIYICWKSSLLRNKINVIFS